MRKNAVNVAIRISLGVANFEAITFHGIFSQTLADKIEKLLLRHRYLLAKLV